MGSNTTTVRRTSTQSMAANDNRQFEEVTHRIEQPIGEDIRDAVNIANVPRNKLTNRGLVESTSSGTLRRDGTTRNANPRSRSGPPSWPNRSAKTASKASTTIKPNNNQEDEEQSLPVAHRNVLVHGHPNEVRPEPNSCPPTSATMRPVKMKRCGGRAEHASECASTPEQSKDICPWSQGRS